MMEYFPPVPFLGNYLKTEKFPNFTSGYVYVKKKGMHLGSPVVKAQ